MVFSARSKTRIWFDWRKKTKQFKCLILILIFSSSSCSIFSLHNSRQWWLTTVSRRNHCECNGLYLPLKKNQRHWHSIPSYLSKQNEKNSYDRDLCSSLFSSHIGLFNGIKLTHRVWMVHLCVIQEVFSNRYIEFAVIYIFY